MKKMFTTTCTRFAVFVFAVFGIASVQAQTPDEPCSFTEILDFNDYNIEDVTDRPNSVSEILDSGTTIKLIGNSWRQINLDYVVTENTVLEFEFKSDIQGRRHGLGFTNDGIELLSNLDTYFQLYGPDRNFNLIYNYANYAGNEWVTYRIPVGQFYQGSFDRLAFMNSNSSGGNGNSYFRNIVISEQITGSCTLPNGNPGFYEDCQCVEITTCPAINFDNYAILPYGVDVPQDEGQYYVQDAGQTLMIVENAWKSIIFNYNVTSNTILDFDFKSTAEGEIHAIGLDDDDIQTANRTIQLFGTQSNFGIQTYNNYTFEDDWKSYSIPLGTISGNTGARSRLFFVGDDDDAPVDANSFFRSVKIYEDGNCYPDCVPPSFSCAAPIKAIADENGEALVNFMAMPEGTNLEIAYQYLGQPITSPATFSTGVHHLIATATNECGAALSECITITVLSCRDNDAAQNYDNVPGFGPWAFNHTGNAGNFIASSTENGDGDGNGDGDINTINAFGLFANGDGLANMTRPFTNPLLPGERFSVDFDNGFIDFGATVGIALQNTAGDNLIEFYFIGGQADYKLNADGGETGTGIGFTDEGLSLSFELKAGGVVDIQITNLGNGNVSNFTRTLLSPGAGQEVAQLRFFNANAGNGSSNNAYINSLSLCQTLIDADGDGFSESEDCDDNDPAVNPGAEEINFDGIDNDCNPETPDENSGIFESFLILNNNFYDLKASTDLPDFTGEIGTFGCDAPLVLDGAQNKTFKCPQGDGDILNGKLFYRIYAQGDAPGSFVELNLGFGSDDDLFFGCQNQTWQTNDANTNLTEGLTPGTYVIEVYTTADYTYSGGADTHQADNDGANFIATIQIVDETAPTVVTEDITVQLGADGTATIGVDDIDNGSTDACGIASRTLDITSFSCSNVGTPVTVQLTVTDINGNPASATATVTVEDSVAPNVVTQDITVNLGADGTASIGADDIDNGSADACGIASRTLDITSFSCSNVGTPVTVQLTVTDINGNPASATATVTVEDNVAPNVVTQDITVQLDADGTATIDADDIDNGSTDACGIASRTLDITSFSCSNVGTPVTVQLTVTDNNGNPASATATVIVEDNVAPNAIAQNVTVQLDAAGFGSTTAEAVNDGSNDACGIASLDLSQTAFDCTHIGANDVTLTVTDANGNVATATAVVTVLAPIDGAVASISSTVEVNSSNNIVIFANAAASLELPDATTLTASIAPSSFIAASYQWFVRDLPDGTFISIAGADQAELLIDAAGDTHREYLVEITTTSGCFAEASAIVFSVNTSCGKPGKVLICHVPPGNPDNAKNICVNQNAVDALLANSDSYIGSCDVDYKMNELEALQVNIYPNPTHRNINLSLEGGNIKAEMIQIFDMQGRLIQSLNVTEYENALLMEIDLSLHENGIYILNVIGNSQVISTKKVLKTM